jgi:hypothetical protein
MSPAHGNKRNAGILLGPRESFSAWQAPSQLPPRATALVDAVLPAGALQLIAAEGAQNAGQPALAFARQGADLLLLVGAAPDDDAQVA